MLFDSFKQTSAYNEPYNWIAPSLLEYAIQSPYSKELQYLQQVRQYKEGWDSYDGKIADENSLDSSIKILCSLASELKKTNTLSYVPEFLLGPDGILGLEWDYAKDCNLFARIYSPNFIEYTLSEKNIKQPTKETHSADFIEMCKKKLQHHQEVA